ncbi:MAG: alpha/beta fold hydrolase [Clostridia bacterium]|nr:alpha/beta fold hydrolase [Clostridia bacterium]
MTSSRKKILKRVGLSIILVLLSYILVSSVVTKVVYDNVFTRYDQEPMDYHSAHAQLIKTRKTYEFLSGDANLTGYLYPADSDKLVVLVPGYHASADNYLWQILHLNQSGIAVFCFDPTGSCQSEGESAIGFSQITFDCKAALDMIINNQQFGYQSLYLMGHSRGAYGICSLLNQGYPIEAAITVSGVNTCMDAIMQPVAEKVGFLAYTNYPYLWGYQSLLFGSEAVNTESAKEIAKSNLPVMIVQGVQDEVYPTHQYSLYHATQETNADNISYYICEKPGQNGHTNLLFDADGTQNRALMEAVCRFIHQNERKN